MYSVHARIRRNVVSRLTDFQENRAVRGIVLEHRVERSDLALGGVWVRGTSVSTPVSARISAVLP